MSDVGSSEPDIRSDAADIDSTIRSELAQTIAISFQNEFSART